MTLRAGRPDGPIVEVEVQEGGMHTTYLEKMANQRYANGYKIEHIVFEPGNRQMVVVWTRFR
jgi:hypothetical protein